MGPQPYHLVHDHEDPGRRGLDHGGYQLSNFTLEVVVDVESPREFKCRATLDGTTSEFTIPSEDFASNTRLPEAIYAAVGPKACVLCKPDDFRTAGAVVSDPVRRTVMTNFGWTKVGRRFPHARRPDRRRVAGPLRGRGAARLGRGRRRVRPGLGVPRPAARPWRARRARRAVRYHDPPNAKSLLTRCLLVSPQPAMMRLGNLSPARMSPSWTVATSPIPGCNPRLAIC